MPLKSIQGSKVRSTWVVVPPLQGEGVAVMTVGFKGPVIVKASGTMASQGIGSSNSMVMLVLSQGRSEIGKITGGSGISKTVSHYFQKSCGSINQHRALPFWLTWFIIKSFELKYFLKLFIPQKSMFQSYSY